MAARSRRVSGRPSLHERPVVERQHAAEALEQRGLAGSVRADQPEHFARAHRERDVGQRRQPAVPLGEVFLASNKPTLSRDWLELLPTFVQSGRFRRLGSARTQGAETGLRLAVVSGDPSPQPPESEPARDSLFAHRAVALIEVLICSDLLTQLAIGGTLAAFGYQAIVGGG